MTSAVIANNGKITYSEISIPNGGDVSSVASYLNFDETGKEWYLYKIPHFTTNIEHHFNDAKLKFYRPVSKKDELRKHDSYCSPYVAPRLRPLQQPNEYVKKDVARTQVLDYVFVLATLAEIEKFRADYSISPVFRHRSDQEVFSSPWTTIPKRQMHSLMIVVEGFEHQIQFETPDEQMLQKGDRVYVCGGNFKGVEGILLLNQGQHKGGKIFVGITHDKGVSTAHIPDEHIQVLEFSRNSNHLYYKISAFEKVLDSCLSLLAEGDSLSPELLANLEHFLFRYARVENLTLVNNTKLMACQYAALMLLGRCAEAETRVKDFLDGVMQKTSSRKAWNRYPTASTYLSDMQKKVNQVLKLD